MKTLKLGFIVTLAMVVFTSCKKESTAETTETAQVDPNGNFTVGSDADGACYSILNRIYYDNSSTNFDEFQIAMSWFGAQTSFKNAGTVKVNNSELSNFGNNLYSYSGFSDLFSTNNANWQVSGNAANGIPGFTHVDNSPFATGGYFTLPSSINISVPLTINFTQTANATGIVFGLKGTLGQKNKAILGNANTVTFSPQEMAEVALSNDGIAIIIMPVAITFQTLNGKKIYFSKQIQYARETLTQ